MRRLALLAALERLHRRALAELRADRADPAEGPSSADREGGREDEGSGPELVRGEDEDDARPEHGRLREACRAGSGGRKGRI